MRSTAEVQKSIQRIIDKEIAITQKEIEEFEQKISDNEQFYGCGGWYTQFEKAKQRREDHLDELEAIAKMQGRPVVLQEMKLYPWYCPSCQETFYTEDSRPQNYHNNTIDCPRCTRPIYKAGRFTSWKVQAGSKYTETRPEV